LAPAPLRRARPIADLHAAQWFLAKYGWAEGPRRTAEASGGAGPGRPAPGPVGAALAEAMRRFQKVNALPASGKLDPATLAAMNRPRCGVPDTRPLPQRLARSPRARPASLQTTHPRLAAKATRTCWGLSPLASSGTPDPGDTAMRLLTPAVTGSLRDRPAPVGLCEHTGRRASRDATAREALRGTTARSERFRALCHGSRHAGVGRAGPEGGEDGSGRAEQHCQAPSARTRVAGRSGPEAQSGHHYWRYDSDQDQAHTEDEQGRRYPRPISEGFPGIPSPLDTAFYDRRKRLVYFFKEASVFAFDVDRNQVLGSYPKKMTEVFPGIEPGNHPFRSIDAAYYSYAHKSLFLFKGNAYWRVVSDRDKRHGARLPANGLLPQRPISEAWSDVCDVHASALSV
ncbi:PREDICTED: matrix metalloproteinase-21, partial [Condylura cristata]|uniref:matrix metalloproteinase-21 n=1 Tax=Condylura cristata TaxID=143302 RepID=UPI0003345472